MPTLHLTFPLGFCCRATHLAPAARLWRKPEQTAQVTRTASVIFFEERPKPRWVIGCTWLQIYGFVFPLLQLLLDPERGCRAKRPKLCTASDTVGWTQKKGRGGDNRFTTNRLLTRRILLLAMDLMSSLDPTALSRSPMHLNRGTHHPSGFYF